MRGRVRVCVCVCVYVCVCVFLECRSGPCTWRMAHVLEVVIYACDAIFEQCCGAVWTEQAKQLFDFGAWSKVAAVGGDTRLETQICSWLTGSLVTFQLPSFLSADYPICIYAPCYPSMLCFVWFCLYKILRTSSHLYSQITFSGVRTKAPPRNWEKRAWACNPDSTKPKTP